MEGLAPQIDGLLFCYDDKDVQQREVYIFVYDPQSTDALTLYSKEFLRRNFGLVAKGIRTTVVVTLGRGIQQLVCIWIFIW